MIEFEIVKVDPELDIGFKSISFSNEALTDGVEFISQYRVLEIIRPYLKDPIGTQIVYSSNNLTGTPITGISITDYMGKTLMQLRRVN